jgi:uncharacterized protein YqjF (DUF2071 family)
MSQRWLDLLFAHWPVSVEALRPSIPDRLAIDTFDGAAWIGVVPFRMEAVRPRWLPAVPWLSSFPELNVRTYVTLDDRPGVFFFSLDAGNPVAVSLARRFFSLPYFRARMSCSRDGDQVVYGSNRTHAGAPRASLEGRYGPVGDVFRAEPGTLERFLTERYCLYTTSESVGRRPGTLYRGEIHHAPWPLQAAEATFSESSLLDGFAVEGRAETPSNLLFARSLDVVVWRLKRLPPAVPELPR